ncbi:MAG: hypothetical protein J6V07_01245, partial [Clostridia bacterium]|nr:hypothetical protein [Clostridia bacterium]
MTAPVTRPEEKLGILERQRRSAGRIRALLLMQMGDRLRKRTKHQQRKFYFLLFLQVLAAIAITAILTVICSLLQSMFHIPLGR